VFYIALSKAVFNFFNIKIPSFSLSSSFLPPLLSLPLRRVAFLFPLPHDFSPRLTIRNEMSSALR
jgi:hypothetical protein